MGTNGMSLPLVSDSVPHFDEYCIKENAYLPSTRDRAPCYVCPLEDLCEAGFQEQTRRVLAGENPSLTEDRDFAPADLEPARLLSGLSTEAVEFVKQHVPELETGGPDG